MLFRFMPFPIICICSWITLSGALYTLLAQLARYDTAQGQVARYVWRHNWGFGKKLNYPQQSRGLIG